MGDKEVGLISIEDRGQRRVGSGSKSDVIPAAVSPEPVRGVHVIGGQVRWLVTSEHLVGVGVGVELPKLAALEVSEVEEHHVFVGRWVLPCRDGEHRVVSSRRDSRLKNAHRHCYRVFCLDG